MTSWKGFERKRQYPEALSRNLPGRGLKKGMKNMSG
jgi:hypothetical protein